MNRVRRLKIRPDATIFQLLVSLSSVLPVGTSSGKVGKVIQFEKSEHEWADEQMNRNVNIWLFSLFSNEYVK